MKQFIYDSWNGIMDPTRIPEAHSRSSKTYDNAGTCFFMVRSICSYIVDSIHAFGVRALVPCSVSWCNSPTVGTFKVAEKQPMEIWFHRPMVEAEDM